MAEKTKIEWTRSDTGELGATWNPLRGCSRVSEGCRHCYAEQFARRSKGYQDVVHLTGGEWRWTGEVRFVPEALDLPLRWRRPRRIFVNSMSDLFHEKVENGWLGQIVGVMMLAKQHIFQVLTKRPERMRAWFEDSFVSYLLSQETLAGHGWAPKYRWPLPNVWLGVSVEDQATADQRIPLLLQTPAALRWVSYEPALEPVVFTPWLCSEHHDPALDCRDHGGNPLDWIVVGGESGPDARPFELGWARSVIAQCRAAGTPVFVKQLGARPVEEWSRDEMAGWSRYALQDRKGGELSEWPEDLRVREYPR